MNCSTTQFYFDRNIALELQPVCCMLSFITNQIYISDQQASASLVIAFKRALKVSLENFFRMLSQISSNL